MTIAAKHPYDAIIGNNVKTRRMERNISQTELADHLGITFQQVQKYEKGSNRIGAGRLYIIAEFLESAVLDFYWGVSDEKAMLGLKEQTYRDTRQGMDLCAAMDSIESQKTRRSIETLVKSLS
ncbi:MAG: helix-turn-helix transcriptional regulator [Desulfobacteraceae bacterium]|nr:helix-turn-helix transcriptional regulator [Desulfobacteraceae bacterium]